MDEESIPQERKQEMRMIEESEVVVYIFFACGEDEYGQRIAGINLTLRTYAVQIPIDPRVHSTVYQTKLRIDRDRGKMSGPPSLIAKTSK